MEAMGCNRTYWLKAAHLSTFKGNVLIIQNKSSSKLGPTCVTI